MSTDIIHEYSSFLMGSDSQTLPIIYTADFNIWFDNSSNLGTRKFAVTLNIFGFRNHVMETTHAAAHMLDLIITRESSSLLRNVSVFPICTISYRKPSYFKISLENRQKYENREVQKKT